MKLLVQSDDYGITEACALGCLKAIREGIVRNTGLFANMPWTERVVEWIRPYLEEIAFGLDLNISTGPSLLSKEQIPSLVQEDGTFYTSRQHRELDQIAENQDHLAEEEVYREWKAQIERFIRLVGKKPDYLHPHAYFNSTTKKVSLALAGEYKIPFSESVMADPRVKAAGMGWYQFPPTMENQVQSDMVTWLTEDRDHLLEAEYGMIVCHTGYVDKTLFDLSSFSLYRCKDLEGVTSEKTWQWIRENQVELIRYQDIPNLP